MGFILNTIKRIVKLFIKLLLYTAVFATLIVLIPNLPPYAKFTSIELAPAPSRVGPLAPNEALNNAVQRYKGKLLGPETFQILNGELYTSIATGEIVKISPGGHVTFVTKVGQPCSGLTKEHICGRPLGFQIDERGKYMYISDAYHGIWKVDLNSDKKQLLVSPRVEIDKRKPKLFNSIALSKNGDLYWTDSSSDMHLKDGVYATLLDPSGRVFHYDAARNESKVLVDQLWFPNGLVMSPNNEFLVVAESCRYRLLKHYIAGPKKGQTEIFVDLPGTPDNVRVLPDGSGILVGLYTVFDEEHPFIGRSMAATPAMRKFLARLQRLIEIPFEYFNTVYKHVIFEDIVYHIGHLNSMSEIFPPISGLAQLDWNGNIVASYYNTDRTLKHVSDAIVFNNELYFGNPHAQDFIGSVPAPPLLKKAFESINKVETSTVETKPQTKPKLEHPKPATQPPKTATPPPKATTPSPTKTTTTPPPKSTTPPPPKTTTPPPPKTTTPPPPKTTPSPAPPKTTTPPPTKTTPPPPPKTTPPPPPKTTPPPPPKTTPPPPPQPTRPPPPKTTPPPSKTTSSSTKPAVPKTEQQPKEPPKSTTAKPEVTTATPPKQSTPPKTASKPNEPQKTQKQETPEAQGSKEQIPITEEIPSDTTKPPKETLKVIKKGGVPTEIPVPNL